MPIGIIQRRGCRPRGGCPVREMFGDVREMQSLYVLGSSGRGIAALPPHLPKQNPGECADDPECIDAFVFKALQNAHGIAQPIPHAGVLSNGAQPHWARALMCATSTDPVRDKCPDRSSFFAAGASPAPVASG